MKGSRGKSYTNLYEVTKDYQEGSLWCATTEVKLKISGVWAEPAGPNELVIFLTGPYDLDKRRWIEEPICVSDLNYLIDQFPHYTVIKPAFEN